MARGRAGTGPDGAAAGAARPVREAAGGPGVSGGGRRRSPSVCSAGPPQQRVAGGQSAGSVILQTCRSGGVDPSGGQPRRCVMRWIWAGSGRDPTPSGEAPSGSPGSRPASGRTPDALPVAQAATAASHTPFPASTTRSRKPCRTNTRTMPEQPKLIHHARFAGSCPTSWCSRSRSVASTSDPSGRAATGRRAISAGPGPASLNRASAEGDSGRDLEIPSA